MLMSERGVLVSDLWTWWSGENSSDAFRSTISTLVASYVPLNDGDRMGGRARRADEAQRRGREQELVPPVLGAGLGEALGVDVVHEGEAEERDGEVHGHAEAGVAARALVHHVPGDGGDVFGAEPLEAGQMQARMR